MIRIQGFYWPDDVGEKWKHSLRHVRAIEWAIARCKRRRTALQAGGNMGLWPRRLAKDFQRVITFEPDPISHACLERNLAATSVHIHRAALGEQIGRCEIAHKSLGSHRVIDGDSIPVVTIDSLGLADLDLLALDLEGYEWHALAGARETLACCRPIVQVELRDFTEKYGHSTADVVALLASLGYDQVGRQGADSIFEVSR